MHTANSRRLISFKPGDANIQQMVNQAYDAALTVVAIIPVNNYGFSVSLPITINSRI
jgi:hypothetical protein